MATITKFEDIAAWQKARAMCQRVFELINRGHLPAGRSEHYYSELIKTRNQKLTGLEL